MKFLKLLSLLSLAGIAGLSLFTWFSGDDICYLNELARYSVIRKAWLQYMYWDGRSLGIASLIQLAGLKYFTPQAISLTWAFSFIGMAMMVLKINQPALPGITGSRVSVISTGLLTCIMWLGMWKLVPDILYWPTGGWYCIMCLLGLVWVYIFQNDLERQRFTTGRNVFILLCSLVCGINSHNLITALLLIALIELAHASLVLKDKNAARYIVFSLAGLAAGAAIVLLAPGNQERLKAIEWQGYNASFLSNLLVVAARYAYWLFGLVLLLSYLAWLCGYKIDKVAILNLKQSATQIHRLKNIRALVTSLRTHKYLLAAISTILVFSATSFFAVPRTAIFFAVFLILYFLQVANIHFQKINSARFIYGSIAFLILFLGIISYEMTKVYELKQQLMQREAYYRSNKGNDVAVAAIPPSSIPFAFSFVDISADSAFWVNRCVALHHGLKTVRTASK